MQFALSVSPNPDLTLFERHGESPSVFICQHSVDAQDKVREAVSDFHASTHKSLAIIVKTQTKAIELYRALSESDDGIHLLDPESTRFPSGVVICSVLMAKGLEFDRVAAFDASEENYRTEMDRNLLYIACTRAMHQLTLISIGKPSKWIRHGVEDEG
jgi:DNA helicase-2/ATP-dependent DNA helicase PcrA